MKYLLHKPGLRIPDEHGFLIREKIGLKPNIKTALDFAVALDEGVNNAKAWLVENAKTPHFDADAIAKVHSLIFKEIHPWAGEFRKNEPGWSKNPVSEAKLIQTDLTSLHLQSKGWFASPDLTRSALEIAAFNIGIQSIDPFKNGTQTVARLTTEHQTYLKLERAINLESDLRVYVSAIQQGLKGNMNILAGQILEHSGFARAAERQRVERNIEEATKELQQRRNEDKTLEKQYYRSK